MNDLNYVLLTGKLTRDPELKMLTADTPMCRFTIATHRYYKKKGSDSYSTDTSFFFVESWGDLADNSAQYLSKGRVVRITGHLKQTSWKDKLNGDRPVERTYIVAEHIEFGSMPHYHAQNTPETEEVKKGLDKDASTIPQITEKDMEIAEKTDENENN